MLLNSFAGIMAISAAASFTEIIEYASIAVIAWEV